MTIHFHQILRKTVEEEINAEVERLVAGYSEFSVYREQVGYIRGLKTVLIKAEEIEKGLT